MEIGSVKAAGGGPVLPGSGRTDEKDRAERNLARVVQDTLRISQEGRDKAREMTTFSWLQEQIESANGEADATTEKLKVVLRCQKIAAHIMKGDKMDPKDLQYLMEHDSKGYQMAMAMRKIKKDPDECDRITEDEEEQRSSSRDGVASAPTVEGGEAAPEAPAPAEGGECAE